MRLVGLLVVFGCLFVGELLVALTKLPLPPSIIGLLLLFLLLNFKKVALSDVEPVANTLLMYLAFLITPVCIALMQYFEMLAKDMLALVVGSALSTLLVLFVSAKTHAKLRKSKYFDQQKDDIDG